jgi:nudix-type nucleoside diphosphatase (YffH/AdpP family)
MADRILRPPLVVTERHAVFLYGTLCDPDLYRIVAGEAFEFTEAQLSGYTVNWVAGENFPILRDAPDRTATGCLVLAGTEARARMDYYELGFGYILREVSVDTRNGPKTALVYLPEPGRWPPGQDWSLPDWQTQHGPLSRAAAADYMALFDRFSPEAAAAMFPQIKSRAFSRLRAAAAPSPAAFDPAFGASDVRVTSSNEPFTGFFALREDRLSHPRFDGTQSPDLTRISLIGGDAVTVLPYDPDLDAVLVIRQFRHGPFARGDANPWCLEPVAGRIDAYERAEDCARRELFEEAGLEAEGMLRIAAYYPTPGAFSEHITSFIALCDLSGPETRIGGQVDEHEDIMSHVIGFDTLLAMVESGAANTGPLLLSALWLAPRRAALRARSIESGAVEH